MAIMQVTIPEKKQSPFASMLSMGAQGASLYGMFGGAAASGAGASGGSAAGGMGLGVTPMAPPTEGMSPVLGGGQLPAASGEAATSGAGAMAAPIAVGAGAGAFGAKAQVDRARFGADTPNAKYASKDMNPTIHADTGAMSRRMEGISGGIDDMKSKLVEGKMALKDLAIDPVSKGIMGKKIDLGLSKLNLKF